MKEIIIDAKDTPIGRLASYAAKQSLLGSRIIIVNCNSAVISGKKSSIVSDYKTMIARGKGEAFRGPHFPRTPEKILKRTVRGMLSYKQGRGREALKRIICYNKTPLEFEKKDKLSLSKQFKIKTLALEELSKII